MCVFFLLSPDSGRHVSPLERLYVALCIRLGEARVTLPTRHPDFADCRQEWGAHCCQTRVGYVCALGATISPSSQQIADSTRDCLQCHYRASCTASDAKVTIDWAAWQLFHWFFRRHSEYIERSWKSLSDMFERMAKKKRNKKQQTSLSTWMFRYVRFILISSFWTEPFEDTYCAPQCYISNTSLSGVQFFFTFFFSLLAKPFLCKQNVTNFQRYFFDETLTFINWRYIRWE